MSHSLLALKQSFAESNPDLARQLDSARTQEEMELIHEAMLGQALERMARAMGKEPHELDDADTSPQIALSTDSYNNLINARGDDIEALLHVLLDGLQRLQGMDQDDAYQVAAQVLMTGALAIGKAAVAASESALVDGVTTAIAAYLGVTAMTVEATCAIAAFLVLLIVVPIIYFMKKPALCLVLMINETDGDISWKGDANIHGKPTLHLPSLDGATAVPGKKVIKAGFVATEKRDNALQGTQYGFVYSAGAADVSIGVECPLAFGDNKGYVAFDLGPQQAAEQVDDQGGLFSQASNGSTNASIRCNSGSGSVAYYVGRVYAA